MKTRILIGVCCLFCLLPFCCTGCISSSSLLEQIPSIAFEKFEYDRAGNVTSMHISATGAKIKNNILTIDEVSIKADYGPAVNFSLQLEGYQRTITETEDTTTTDATTTDITEDTETAVIEKEAAVDETPTTTE